MATPRILALIGGISTNSINKKLFHAFQERIGGQAEFVVFDISKLPFFSQDLENDPPDYVTFFKDEIREADAILFVTPEYNHSIPGVLKNAIDWGSRPYGMSLWEKVPAGLRGASAVNLGTYGAQLHLRQILNYLDMFVMNQPEFYLNGTRSITADGKLDDKTYTFVDKFWNSFKIWIEQHQDGAVKPVKKESQRFQESPGIH